MAIDGNFYRNDVKLVLRAGPMKLQQIKSKLVAKGISLDETQILEALEGLIRSKSVMRFEGKFQLTHR